MSFELVVVRHAIDFERDPERWSDDGLRPLSPGGKRKFQQAAR
jgi:phosphohistidine phosphatase SixA